MNIAKSVWMAGIAFGVALLALAGEGKARDRVMILAAHPDDLGPCAGFALLTKDIFEFHVVDFTYGQLGLGQKGADDGSTQAIRTKEEEKACAMIGAKLHWLGGMDGSLHATPELCAKLRRLIEEIRPRAIITHWPVDVHPDHVMTAAITLKTIRNLNRSCDEDLELYFFDCVYQPRTFSAAHFVEVSSVKDARRELLRCYQCQNPEEQIRMYEESNAVRAETSRIGAYRGKMYECYADFGFVTSGRRTIFDEVPLKR